MSVRSELLDAGRRLCEKHRLSEIGAVEICRNAQLVQAAFETQFTDFDDYLIALQQQFMTELRDAIVAATLSLPAGLPRFRAGAAAYLEGCLERRALRNWLVEARMRPRVFEGLLKQNQTYLVLLGLEFAAFGAAHPPAAARLFLAMLNEAALLEQVAGRAQAEVREMLWDFLASVAAN